MAKCMLLDASHPGETRAAIIDGNRLLDYDVELKSKEQIKSNIYLAKVVRLERSLEAAFVEYGGNRHGFLAFSEIHPDYYRIPVEDREALLAELAQEAAAEEAEEERSAAQESSSEEGGSSEGTGSGDGGGGPALASPPMETISPADTAVPYENKAEKISSEEYLPETSSSSAPSPLPPAEGTTETAAAPIDFNTPTEETTEERPARRSQLRRRYNIQEVIRKGQVLLVQVVKEERGNKGAALTTYLSLPGRYCVLMPNTPRGGGISRKITNMGDRKRLKDMMESLGVPDGMAVILRTAGMERPEADIRRDLDYLMQLWDNIREQTLQSVAPKLIYKEANLVKRAIRDLYTADIEAIHVEGDEAYAEARDLMKVLMPSHARKVHHYKSGGIPLFYRYQVEKQIDSIHSPSVQLRSGGYIVINQTEALVAIDVNSGRATRERNIEETAFRTNLEAADEIARQVRLRDLAGLIVIDFIDMEENRNNISVERRLKEAMKHDRARTQMGRISMFGLLEMSRQRLRPSLAETHHEKCPHCSGTGTLRSAESAALIALRAVEEEAIRRRSSQLMLTVPTRVALFVLNQKRSILTGIEASYGLHILVQTDDTLISPDYKLDRVRATTGDPEEERMPVTADNVFYAEATATGEGDNPPPAESGGIGNTDAVPVPADENADPGRSRRRRGGNNRHRRRFDRDAPEGQGRAAEGTSNAIESLPSSSLETSFQPDDGQGRRRRGRRGGRHRREQRPDYNAAPAEGRAPVDQPRGPVHPPASTKPTSIDELFEASERAYEQKMSNPSAAGSSEPGADQKTSAQSNRRGWWNRLINKE